MGSQQQSESQSLAEPLRSALANEIDPNESLRWCGQPSPDAAFWRAMVPATIGALALIVFGGLAAGLSYSTWRELRGLEPLLGPSDRRPTYEAAVIFGIFGVLLLLASPIVAHSPWRAIAAAKRTIYAVTNTRVLELILSSTEPDASTTIQAVEPGHPLHIRRTTEANGEGNILLYPRGGNLGQITLIGVSNSREVERIIRTTFDPPGAHPPAANV